MHPSTLSFGKSFSRSSKVNSASADRVDTLVSASLLLHKGVTSPWGWPTGRVDYDGRPSHYCSICDLAYYLIFHFTPTSLSPSFFLEMCQPSSALCLQVSVELW